MRGEAIKVHMQATANRLAPRYVHSKVGRQFSHKPSPGQVFSESCNLTACHLKNLLKSKVETATYWVAVLFFLGLTLVEELKKRTEGRVR